MISSSTNNLHSASTLQTSQSFPFQLVEKENDSLQNIEKYSKFGIEGTSWLAFRDVPALFKKYVRGENGIDYGCGAGRSTRFIKSLNLTPIGVDISEKMLTEARSLDPSTQYMKIESGQIPIADKAHDFVFSSFVFLVIPTKNEMKKVLTEIHRVLKDNGSLIIVTGSEKIHSKQMNWHSYITDYPENDHLSSGSVAKLGIKEVGALFFDYNWLDADYQCAFKESGFDVLEHHTPYGKATDGYPWQSETDHSPYAIYVLKKSRNETNA